MIPSTKPFAIRNGYTLELELRRWKNGVSMDDADLWQYTIYSDDKAGVLNELDYLMRGVNQGYQMLLPDEWERKMRGE